MLNSHRNFQRCIIFSQTYSDIYKRVINNIQKEIGEKAKIYQQFYTTNSKNLAGISWNINEKII